MDLVRLQGFLGSAAGKSPRGPGWEGPEPQIGEDEALWVEELGEGETTGR